MPEAANSVDCESCEATEQSCLGKRLTRKEADLRDFMDTPICDFIKEYEAKGISRLHMPGHKGVPFLGCENRDITEICGADELYEAEGIIAASEKNANALFGFGKTIYGTEGSSQCIRTMLFLALQARENRTERPVVLAARNAHKAFLYSCALLDVDVEWLLPEGTKSLCACPITAEQVAEGLKKSSAFAVYITAPDYLGYSPDIKGIAAACRAAGVPLLVDNAHGAYLKFLHPSKHPLDLGAAMSCDSAHKTLPVLTGGAYLHLSEEWAERVGRQAKKAMELFGSTSPSYLILQSLDLCNRYLAEGYREKLQWTIGQIGHLRGQLKKQGWTVMMDSDPLKLTIFTGEKGYHGREVAEILRAHEVECEFADLDAAVLHDIGKSFQYRQQIPHEIAGERIARRILDSLPTGFTFTDEEKALICLAVRGHRRRHEHMKPIEELFYESDKRSRMCLSCMAEKKCNWNEEEKNMEIII